MNFIKQLQSDNHALAAALARVETEISSFQSFLQNSPKFQGFEQNGERKDWISTSDVIARLMEIRRAAVCDTFQGHTNVTIKHVDK
jgi:hypothetical protein